MSAAAIVPDRSAALADDQDDGLAAELETAVSGILSRRPAVGLALGVLRSGRLAFRGRGLADIVSETPVAEDTVFRIGSITKTVTAVAVMQLWERGLIDLDAPANAYLRAYRVLEGSFQAPTVRHLLTHTSGIPDLLHVSDLLRGSLTPSGGRPPALSVPAGEPLPALAEYYRAGLRVVAPPGRSFAYSNHGFATLGQIIEDVTGLSLARYFRERIFEPLGMVDTELVRTERLASRLATGYALGRRGPTPVPDEDWIGAGAGAIYSTARDLARYAEALVGGGSNDRGSILDARTLATMFEPQFEPDSRLRGMGLGFFRRDVGGHRVVSHDGILPGFNAELLVAPDDRIAIVGLTNGSPGAFGWLSIELEDVLRRLVGVPGDTMREDVAQRPETWGRLCGRYVLQPPADLRQRLMFGAGVEVFVGGDRLMVRVLTPIPALYRGLELHPDDSTDPTVFRLDLRPFGMSLVRVVFGAGPDGRATVVHTDLGGQPWSLAAAPDTAARRTWLRPLAGALALAGTTAVLRRRRRSR